MGILIGASSCLLILPSAGITKLSELEIDTDKDWNGKGIYNVKEVNPSMVHGDLTFRDSDIISRLPAGAAGSFLQTCGSSRDPWWRAL